MDDGMLSSTSHHLSPFGAQQCFTTDLHFMKSDKKLILNLFNISFSYFVLCFFISEMPSDAEGIFIKLNSIVSCR